jgi:heme oxygenase
MKLRKVFTMTNPRVKYNVNFLKNKITKEQFNITLSNKFQILEELDTIEDQWSQIKYMINNTCEETLGRKSYTQKEWITPETLRKVQERKQKKGAINSSRTR